MYALVFNSFFVLRVVQEYRLHVVYTNVSMDDVMQFFLEWWFVGVTRWDYPIITHITCFMKFIPWTNGDYLCNRKIFLILFFLGSRIPFIIRRSYANRTVNSSWPGQNGHHFADEILRCIFVNGKACIVIKTSLKSVRKGPIDNNSALVQIMAWRRIGDKPLFEPMLTRFTDAYMRH